jgi:hypothetical protein
MKISDLAAFDPKKLAAKLLNLPEGAIVFSLGATGPAVAMPRPISPAEPVVGQCYHHEDCVSVWSGGGFVVIAQLTEWDGKPTLVSRP